MTTSPNYENSALSQNVLIDYLSLTMKHFIQCKLLKVHKRPLKATLLVKQVGSFHLLFCLFILFIYLLPFFFFLEPHSWHTEVPRLGVELELQLQTYTTASATQDPNHICNLHLSSQQPTEQGQGWNLQPHGS